MKKKGNMEMRSRLLVAIASAILVMTFFFPIWKIDLNAPQYPEGLGLRIWLNQVSGLKEHDLQSINGLNHYIGMKEIVPGSIPELKIMPYILIFLILFGFTAAYFGNKKMIYIWLGLFVVLAAIGLYDFYLWEYNYGHDLNPNAPIKIPGMSYQPPLIGSKQLLNINAVSMPAFGTYIMILSVILMTASLFIESKLKKGAARK